MFNNKHLNPQNKYLFQNMSHNKAYPSSTLSPPSNAYYCHYSNAVYMGGMQAFKKTGPGILLLDSGASAIVCHSHDTQTQFSIVFKDHSITMVTVRGNRSRLVTHRVGAWLMVVGYNSRGAVGYCYLVDFRQKRIFRMTYFGNKIDKKQQILDKQVLHSIFTLHNYSPIIQDPNHLQCLYLNFNIYPTITSKHNTSDPSDNTFKIGYFDKVKNQSNGLAFSVKIHNVQDKFDVKMLERGYYLGNKMEKFGQIWFQNGNYYVGGLRDGLFQGFGMLVHPKEAKWTYSVHKKGQISSLLDSSTHTNLRLSSALLRIHQSCQPYIQDTIKVCPSSQSLFNLLQQGWSAAKNGQDLLGMMEQNMKKMNNYRTIKQDYVSGNYEHTTEVVIGEELGRSKSNLFRSKPKIKRDNVGDRLNRSRTKSISKSKSNTHINKSKSKIERQGFNKATRNLERSKSTKLRTDKSPMKNGEKTKPSLNQSKSISKLDTHKKQQYKITIKQNNPKSKHSPHKTHSPIKIQGQPNLQQTPSVTELYPPSHTFPTTPSHPPNRYLISPMPQASSKPAHPLAVQSLPSGLIRSPGKHFQHYPTPPTPHTMQDTDIYYTKSDTPTNSYSHYPHSFPHSYPHPHSYISQFSTHGYSRVSYHEDGHSREGSFDKNCPSRSRHFQYLDRDEEEQKAFGYEE